MMARGQKTNGRIIYPRDVEEMAARAGLRVSYSHPYERWCIAGADGVTRFQGSLDDAAVYLRGYLRAVEDRGRGREE